MTESDDIEHYTPTRDVITNGAEHNTPILNVLKELATCILKLIIVIYPENLPDKETVEQ